MNVDELLVRTLERHATEAPPATNLAPRARATLRTRRQRRAVMIAIASVVAVAAVALTMLQLPKPLPPADGAMPSSWRWESYKGIQVQVPTSWGYGTAGWPWCLDQGVGKAYVGRPGAVPAIGCVGDRPPALPGRAAYLWFDSARTDENVTRFDHGWVRETRTVAGVEITVFTDDARLRRRILDTAQPVENEDANGCPIRQSFTQATLGMDLPNLAGGSPIRSASLCSYGPQGKSGIVVASTRLPDEPARKLAAAILAAPEGSGPNAPRENTTCPTSEVVPPENALLIRFQTTTGHFDVQVSIDECAGRWARDGQTLRKLTSDLMRRAFVGPHRITEYDSTLAPLVPK